jgi:hypothetical protein
MGNLVSRVDKYRKCSYCRLYYEYHEEHICENIQYCGRYEKIIDKNYCKICHIAYPKDASHCCECKISYDNIHCCECKISYLKDNLHCCKCKISYNNIHCCKCKKEYDNIGNMLHCIRCCIDYDKEQNNCCNCLIAYDKEQNHCCNCLIAYDKEQNHCCNCLITYDKEQNHCCKCKKVYENEVHCNLCCCVYTESMKHCCACQINYPNDCTHCCKCEAIYNVGVHCCGCKKEFDNIGNVIHCTSCCITYDRKQQLHCCKCSIIYEKKENHCCKCRKIYKDDKHCHECCIDYSFNFSHCCKCKLSYDHTEYNHCDHCCSIHSYQMEHCCICLRKKTICKCSGIYTLATKIMKEFLKDINKEFIVACCLKNNCSALLQFIKQHATINNKFIVACCLKNNCSALLQFIKCLNLSIFDFLKDNNNFIIVYHGTDSAQSAHDICCNSWLLSKRGIKNGQQHGKGEYFTSNINTAKEYSGLNGSIIISLIPNPVKFKISQIRAMDSVCKTEKWYIVDNSDKIKYVLPVGIINFSNTSDQFFVCKNIF